MKKRYWGFNWEVTPFTGQFGLFWKSKKGWRYFGIPFPFCLIAIIWFIMFTPDEWCSFQIDKEVNQKWKEVLEVGMRL